MVNGVKRWSLATPLTFRHYTGSPSGGVYGVKRRVGQFNPIPPTRVKGLYLTGQAVVLPGLMGAMVSAFVTAGSILGDEKILKELRGMG